MTSGAALSASSASASAPAMPTSGVTDGAPGGVLIVGCGVAGVALALFLHRQGVRVRIYESYALLSDTAGLCLQLGPNGMAVLQALQLEQQLLERGMRGEAFRIVGRERRGDVQRCATALQRAVRQRDCHGGTPSTAHAAD